MTYDLYWHGDPYIAKCYAKANEIVYNRKELDLWKLGVYLMRANACLWDKKAEYPKEPLFKIKTEEEKQMEEINKIKSMRAFWESVAVQNNAKIKQQKEESNNT